MCLAVPGEILDINDHGNLMRTGRVSFAGVIKQINLAYTPEAKVGNYVLVHVGFAISVVNEEEANRIFAELQRLGELDELSN
jgi:hydrogenase expression/formation protein HypC